MDNSKLEESMGALATGIVDTKKVANEVLSFLRKIDERIAAGGNSGAEAEDKRLDELVAGVKAILAQTAPNDNVEKLLSSQKELIQTLNKPPRQDVFHHYGVMKAGLIYGGLVILAGLFIGLYVRELYIKRDVEANEIQWRYLMLAAPEIAGGITIKYYSDPELFRKDVEKEEKLRDEITRQRSRENESHKKAEELNQKRTIK